LRTSRRATYSRGEARDQGLGALLVSRWGVTTALALLAVAFVFVDSLLVVEVQRVSLETSRLNREMEMVRTELDALESHWALESSHIELGEKAAGLGFRIPDQDQVVELMSSFLESRRSGAPAVSEQVRHEFTKNWTKLVVLGTP
jgi:hypothetical protein